MNLLLRYAQISHSGNIYRDYYQSGLGLAYRPLSDKGIKHAKQYRLPFKPVRIVTADTNACTETGEIFAGKFGVGAETDSSLLNIRHDLSKLITPREFAANSGLEQLRRNFIRDLYADELSESKAVILSRMSALQSLLASGDKLLGITHGLTLVVFKLYLQEGIKQLPGINSCRLIDYNKPFYGPLLGYSYPGLV